VIEEQLHHIWQEALCDVGAACASASDTHEGTMAQKVAALRDTMAALREAAPILGNLRLPIPTPHVHLACTTYLVCSRQQDTYNGGFVTSIGADPGPRPHPPGPTLLFVFVAHHTCQC